MHDADADAGRANAKHDALCVEVLLMAGRGGQGAGGPHVLSAPQAVRCS